MKINNIRGGVTGISAKNEARGSALFTSERERAAVTARSQSICPGCSRVSRVRLWKACQCSGTLTASSATSLSACTTGDRSVYALPPDWVAIGDDATATSSSNRFVYACVDGLMEAAMRWSFRIAAAPDRRGTADVGNADKALSSASCDSVRLRVRKRLTSFSVLACIISSASGFKNK